MPSQANRLYGDKAINLRITGFVDDTHGTAAQLGHNFVSSEPLAPASFHPPTHVTEMLSAIYSTSSRAPITRVTNAKFCTRAIKKVASYQLGEETKIEASSGS